jgi:hypothetical protein
MRSGNLSIWKKKRRSSIERRQYTKHMKSERKQIGKKKRM